MAVIAREIGLAQPPARVAGPAAAILDADFVHRRYSWNGHAYTSEATFLAAAGGARTDSMVMFGPHVAADATELVSNGDFANGTTDWTVVQIGGGPATGAVASGEYTLTGNGADSPAVRQQITVSPGHAYRLRGKAKRGASLSPQIRVSGLANMGNSYSQGASNGLTSYAQAELTFTGLGTGTAMYVGMRVLANPATGTALCDDISVKECRPFAGFVAGSVSGVIEATTPASASGSKVLWQLDDDAKLFDTGSPPPTATERNHARLVWGADTHLHLVVTAQVTSGSTTGQADLDLGAAAAATGFRVAFSLTANGVLASLDGMAALGDSSAIIPGAAVMRLGHSQSGNLWDGSIGRVTLFGSTRSAVELENLSAGSASRQVAAWGDSLTVSSGASTSAHAYPVLAAAAFTPDRAVANLGVGGETSTAIAARVLAAGTALRRRISWIWVGRGNYTDPATVKADIETMVGSLGHDRFLVLSVLNGNYESEFAGEANHALITGLNADLAARYGSRFVDVRSLLIAAGDPVADAVSIAGDVVPASLRSDNIHLNDAGYQVVAEALAAATVAMGW